jgi:hypothetical protein
VVAVAFALVLVLGRARVIAALAHEAAVAVGSRDDLQLEVRREMVQDDGVDAASAPGPDRLDVPSVDVDVDPH